MDLEIYVLWADTLETRSCSI